MEARQREPERVDEGDQGHGGHGPAHDGRRHDGDAAHEHSRGNEALGSGGHAHDDAQPHAHSAGGDKQHVHGGADDGHEHGDHGHHGGGHADERGQPLAHSPGADEQYTQGDAHDGHGQVLGVHGHAHDDAQPHTDSGGADEQHARGDARDGHGHVQGEHAHGSGGQAQDHDGGEGYPREHGNEHGGDRGNREKGGGDHRHEHGRPHAQSEGEDEAHARARVHQDSDAEHGHEHPYGDGHEHAHGDHAHGGDGEHEHGHEAQEHGHDANEHGHEHDANEHGHEHGQEGHELGHEHGGMLGTIRELIRPHSHDAADSVDDALTGSNVGITAVKLSLIGLGATAIAQLVVAIASGSVAVLADTIHNFADASTAIPLWLAFWVSRKPANSRYTYGYGRAEDLAGVFVLLMIVASAAVAAWESFQKLLDPTPIDHLGWVAAAGLFGFIGNEVVAQYRIRVGQRIGSAALVADGYHARTDGLTSLAVLVGAAGVWLGFPRADPIVGLVITLAILLVLKDATVQMWRRLMDAVDPKLLEQATEAARDADGVQDVSTVRARWIGHSIHAEALIVADCELSLNEAHEIAERARHKMLHAVPKLTTVTVHVDPCSHDGQDHHAALAHHDRRG